MSYQSLITCLYAFFVSLSCYSAACATGAKPNLKLGGVGQVEIFSSPSPDAHQPFIDAINSAKKDIQMKMYHLSDQNVIGALVNASKRGVNVRVILDLASLKTPKYQQTLDTLKAGGVKAVASTPMFTITHEKAMVIDSSTAFITTMNVVGAYMNMYDIGVILHDPAVIKEMKSVYEADWRNAANGGMETPPLSNPNLAWSPINAKQKLVDLILSAKREVLMNVENSGHPDIQAALINRAKAGVVVRVMVPMCDIGGGSPYNYPAMAQLHQAGVDARMMPGPASYDLPYMHAKGIIVDGETAYVGSENFSPNSLEHARELGLIFKDVMAASELRDMYMDLFNKTSFPSIAPDKSCTAFAVTTTPTPAP